MTGPLVLGDTAREGYGALNCALDFLNATEHVDRRQSDFGEQLST